jgi:hypothetical protein
MTTQFYVNMSRDMEDPFPGKALLSNAVPDEGPSLVRKFAQ